MKLSILSGCVIITFGRQLRLLLHWKFVVVAVVVLSVWLQSPQAIQESVNLTFWHSFLWLFFGLQEHCISKEDPEVQKLLFHNTMLGKLPLRKCVGALILNHNQHLLTGLRTTRKKTEYGRWQFVQGGVDEGETHYQAVIREIHEEVGLKSSMLTFIGQLSEPLTYTFPLSLYSDKSIESEHILRKHRGQQMEWFIFYMKNDDLQQCSLDYEEQAEFEAVKWNDWDHFLTETVSFKKDMYIRLRELSHPLVSPFFAEKSNL